jgi:hypothetical protein
MKIAVPQFKTNKELYDYLVARKQEMIDLKKSELKKADAVCFDSEEIKTLATKAAGQTKADTDTEIERTIVGNTYYWLDSHEDIHVANCFATSIKQRGAARISHLHDHLHQLDAKVGKFSDVYEKAVSWRDLGVNIDGDTVSLMANSSIKSSLNSKIFEMYKAGDIDQHSVGMQYVDLQLMINDPERAKEYALWQAIYPLVGNKAKLDEKGYAWVVKECKLIEISAVLNGSNEVTPTLMPGPSADSQDDNKNEPAEGSSLTNKNHLYYI